MTEQIDFRNIIRRVLRIWYVIIAVSIIAALLTGIVTSRRYRPVYSTDALIVVCGKQYGGSGVVDALQTTSTFTEVITSNLLQKKVAEALGLSALPGDLSCSVVTNTNMITVKATASSPQDVMTVMNGFLDHYDVVTSQVLNNVVLRVLEEPMVPMTATAAYNEAKVMLLAFGVTFILMCGIWFLYFYLRDDIKSESEVEKKLDTKHFATIYHEDTAKGISFLRKNKKRLGLLITSPVISYGYMETFQKIATRVEYQTNQNGYRTIVISSVLENEGKSTVAANLALSLARMGKRVLLVDLDLRKPAIFKLFEISYDKEKPQVGDVLSGGAQLQDAIVELESSKVSVLAGNRSYRNTTRLLVTEEAVAVIRSLEQEVDYVILDTPPLSLVADAEEVMRYADAGLLVVRQNMAKAKDINDAVDIFRNTGCRLLGCVLNDVEVGLTGKRIWGKDGYNYRYGYGYGNYYSKEKKS